jgi:hypothetical protein
MPFLKDFPWRFILLHRLNRALWVILKNKRLQIRCEDGVQTVLVVVRDRAHWLDDLSRIQNNFTAARFGCGVGLLAINLVNAIAGIWRHCS